MITYKHDGDGKIYYEKDGGVVWVCKGLIDNAKEIVNILNKSQTSLQQLKAEIAVIVAVADDLVKRGHPDKNILRDVINDLRQLSAV